MFLIFLLFLHFFCFSVHLTHHIHLSDPSMLQVFSSFVIPSFVPSPSHVLHPFSPLASSIPSFLHPFIHSFLPSVHSSILPSLCCETEEFLRAWEQYEVRLEGLGRKDVQELDHWLRTELPQVLETRSPKAFLKKAELSDVMRWKLRKGTFRPRLQSFVDSNPEEIVQTATEKAFQLVHRMQLQNADLQREEEEGKQEGRGVLLEFDRQRAKEAFQALTKPLKGVGNATASRILGLVGPELFPYFSDELAIAVHGGGRGGNPKPKINYSKLEYYFEMAEAAIRCAARLNSELLRKRGEQQQQQQRQKDDDGKDARESEAEELEFDAETVQLCIWSSCVALKQKKKQKQGQEKPKKRKLMK